MASAVWDADVIDTIGKGMQSKLSAVMKTKMYENWSLTTGGHFIKVVIQLDSPTCGEDYTMDKS